MWWKSLVFSGAVSYIFRMEVPGSLMREYKNQQAL